jgi:heme/copper-type cytochrome/quinol oxidase subunit 2
LPGVKRAAAIFALALTAMLVAAPMALASNGEGLISADDKTVTFFCFGVMAFFVVLVIGMSLIQAALERRKERRRYDIERLG